MANFSVKERKPAHRREHKAEHTDVATRFAKSVDKELGDFLKAAVLFGSCATNKTNSMSDIDVLLIVDDVGRVVSPEVTEAYRLVVHKCATQVSPLLHINTLRLSNFWELCRQGDPVMTNMLRDGIVLLDRGFFGAAQLLLEQGRIRPSKEAIWTYYMRTGNTLKSARQHLLSACIDLYWAAMDASHAALMSMGEVPPTPEHVPDMLERVLVKRKLLDPKSPKIVRELYHLQKQIIHREIKEISGEQYDMYWRETLHLVDSLRTVVEMHPPR